MKNGHTHSEPSQLKLHQPITVIRPAPIEVYESFEKDNNEQEVLKRDLWIRVFTHLDSNDKHSCMLVCKTWNQWCIDPSLWRSMDLSNHKISQSMLKGIVRRQPVQLNLASTNINGKQLEWLLKRLPGLKGLDLSLNTASAISAFMRVTCPPLTYLNLSWCSAIYDRFLTQVLSPVTNKNMSLPTGSSRLQYLENLNITGCDVTDETVNFIFSKLCALRHLTVSHCSKITDLSLDILLKKKAACQDTFETFNCVGCSITEEIVSKLKEKIAIQC